MSPPNRRREDQNLLTYTHRLFSGETVTSRVRWAASAMAAIYGIMGYGPVLNNDAVVWGNAAFNGIFTLARPEAWGAGFWVVSIMMILVATTRKAIMYLWASVLGFAMIFGWMVGVTVEVIVSEEATITSTGFGLYGFALLSIALFATMSASLAANVEIYEREQNGNLVPLRQVERRKAS